MLIFGVGKGGGRRVYPVRTLTSRRNLSTTQSVYYKGCIELYDIKSITALSSKDHPVLNPRLERSHVKRRKCCIVNQRRRGKEWKGKVSGTDLTKQAESRAVSVAQGWG